MSTRFLFSDFIIVRYHASLERPPGTFDRSNNSIYSQSYLEELESVERDICSGCNGRRQLYCGPCGGRRLSGDMLPLRIELPFDLLILVHW